MNDWLHNLPIAWMALLVFGLTALVTAAICVVVMMLSVGERARSFKAVSSGLLPPLGILFALFVAFTATQVWTDNDKANSVVDREASALRTAVILAAAFPGEVETRLRNLIRSHVADAVAQEWPMMARRTATLQIIPYSLAEALQLTLSVTPSSQGQQTAQREITTSLENALDARRQRIIISQSGVNWVKWLCLGLQAGCALLAIAMVHSDNRLATAITMGLFGVGVAASLLLILAHDRPFTGELAVSPKPLLQVMPALGASQERSSFDPVMGNRMPVNGTKHLWAHALDGDAQLAATSGRQSIAARRRTSTHCHQGADFELKTLLDSYMLLNAIEEQKPATPLWIFACQPPRGDRDQKMQGGSVQMRHIILFSIAAVVLAGVAAWVVTSIQSQRTPTVSQFDPFSLEERAKNLPTQEWLDRNMWPNNVD